MLKRKSKASSPQKEFFENLEDRRLLSASMSAHLKFAVETKAEEHHHSVRASDSSTTGSSTTTFSGLQTTDVAAYNELSSLATTDKTTIASTQTIYIRPINSTTTYYTVVLTPSTGTKITLTSDEDGNPVTPPTSSKTTFGAVLGTSTTSGTDPTAANALTSLAAALDLTAPAFTDTVKVHTADGLTTYTVRLAPSSGTGHDQSITVDAAGNPAGHETIPFSALAALNSTISGGLTTLASAQSLTIPSTQNVRVITSGGVTTYTVDLTSSGQSEEFTVDTRGAAATTPTGGGFGAGCGGGVGGGFGGHGIHTGS